MNCPHCHRLLYSRQHPTCGYCGLELPKEMRLTDDEIASLKAEERLIAERHAIAREEEEEAKQRAAASAATIAASMMMIPPHI